MVSVFGDVTKYLPHLVGACAVLLVVIVVASLGIRRSVKAEVDAPGMFGVVGRMGSGKTYLQAKLARDALGGSYKLKCPACWALGKEDAPAVCDDVRTGPRPVYANFRVDGAQPLDSWDDIVRVPFGAKADGTTGALVLLDEAQLWWPSSAWNAPAEVKAWCAQVRKRRITFVWSSQHQTHVAKRLLQLTFGVWSAKVLRGIHVYALYEPTEFGKERAKSQARVKYKRTKAVMDSYDTEEVVPPQCDWDTSGKPAATGERVRNEHRAGSAADAGVT